MNQIPYQKALAEIGMDAVEDLLVLRAFLGDSLLPTPRIAQSIITRSEVELFGLSIPRFAVRMYLRRGGFVNCRRMAVLASMFHKNNETEWGDRYREGIRESERNREIDNVQLPHRPIHDVLQGQSCVADSLLPQPARLDRYHFRYIDTSRCKLLEAYGEDPRSDAGLLRRNPGYGDQGAYQEKYSSGMIPFTKQMNLGGGLCAQAASFMASAMLAPYSQSVHGLAEITALAHEDECRELSLGILTPEAMSRYFERINLRLSEQCLTRIPSHKASRHRIKKLASVIRCYIQSSMPVVLPTCMRKLASSPTSGNSIYANNGLLIKKDAIPDEVNHAVVITGYKTGEQELFTMNDSATVPFLVASGEELHSVGATRSAPKGSPDNGVIMPVVPKPVRMPLLEERTKCRVIREQARLSPRGFAYGLDTISRTFHYLSNYPLPAQPNLAGDRFQLVRSDAPDLDWRQSTEPHRTLLECGLLHATSHLEKVYGWHTPHWFWVEMFPEQSLWLWDAETEPPAELPETKDDFLSVVFSKYLLGVVYYVFDNKTDIHGALFDPLGS